MQNRYFISYSAADGAEHAQRLADDLQSGPPAYPVWLFQREMRSAIDWDEQLVEQLKNCQALILVLTPDSVHSLSGCKQEWTRALKYKKPVIPLRFHPDADLPFRLEPRQCIDFTTSYDVALARLRRDLAWRKSTEGLLHGLEERLQDAERDLSRASEPERARIETEMSQLRADIERSRGAAENPATAAQVTEARIQSGLQRERLPAEPARAQATTRFVNPPPARAPSWFQDRHVETGLIADFLRDEGLRMLHVLGRGGTGKTAMVCRLLKSLEGGKLPDDGGEFRVEGIVYLSPLASRQLYFPHFFADLCRLLPEQDTQAMAAVQSNAALDAAAKMRLLLERFPAGCHVVLLDNAETIIDDQSQALKDAELQLALRALLELPQHSVKVILTSRIPARDLLTVQPGRQSQIRLDEGLESPHAENVLRARDKTGELGLRDAPLALLDDARRRTRGFPRALEALAGILAADRATTLAELLEDIGRLKAVSVVETLVGEAFSRLDPQAQRVMQALAVFGHTVPATAVDFLLQPFFPGIDSALVLRRLVNQQFVRSESGRFHLHPVDRDYALSRLPQVAEEDRQSDDPGFSRDWLFERAADYFEAVRLPREDWKCLDDLQAQLAEIELRVSYGDGDAAAAVLNEIAFEPLMLWGHAGLVLQFAERVLPTVSDPHLKWVVEYVIGNAHRRLSSYRRAIDYFDRCLAAARDEPDLGQQAAALNALGLCHRCLGEYRSAINLHEQSLQLAKDLGDQQGEANALGSLGNCFYCLSEYRRAIDLHEQNLQLARDIGDQQGEATALGNLGICHSSLGEYRLAIELHEQSLQLAKVLSDRQVEANALGNLGNCFFSLGKYSRAIELNEQSLQLANDLGDRQDAAISLGALGSCYYCLGDFHRAINLHEQHRQVAKEVGDRQSESAALGNQSRTRLALGNLSLARSEAAAARDLAAAIDDPYVETCARIYLGEALEMDGEAVKALDELEKACELADTSGDVEPRVEARLAMGIALLRQGEPESALRHVERACELEYGRKQARSLAAAGVASLMVGQTSQAQDRFLAAKAQANSLWKLDAGGLDDTEAAALAACGLVLLGDADCLAQASDLYAKCRSISSAPGVVAMSMQWLDLLAPLDTQGQLAPARAAAQGLRDQHAD